VGSELAYTVGYEHGQVATDGNRQPVRIRATHIYRREQDEWRLVHRHGDLAPVDDIPWPCCIWSVRGRLKR
jgi:ketosteroid isomerase-like protein